MATTNPGKLTVMLTLRRDRMTVDIQVTISSVTELDALLVKLAKAGWRSVR